MYDLRKNYGLQAKFESLTRKNEVLELKKTLPVKIYSRIMCQIYEIN
jgi:hypothetical protein